MAKQIGAKALIPNPALRPFESLIGEWRSTGHHPYFPNAELHGRTVFKWIEGGAFLVVHSELDHPQFPNGVAIFGSDDEAGEYYQMYFDERGISRKYEVTIKEGELKWWRNDEHFSQRFTMIIEKDVLKVSGEMSRDGGEWEKDLSVMYERIK